MIGVTGKWLANFSMGFDPFIYTDNLLGFTVIEEAGNVLPTFELAFKTSNDKVVGYINEGNTINASMGVTELSLSNLQLKPLKKTLSRYSGSEFGITVKGMLDKIGYLTSAEVTCTPKQSAVETIIQQAGKFFNVDADIPKSNDVQNWIKNGLSAGKFVNELWKRSNLGTDDFPMVGITSNGDFRLRSLNVMKNSSAPFNFSIKDQGSNTYRYSSDYIIESDTGLMNYVAGYDSPSNVVNLDQGIASLLSSVVTNGFAITNILEKALSAGAAVGETLIQNGNMNSMFHQAAQSNMKNLATFSSSRIQFTVPDVYVPIKVLDVFTFKDDIDTAAGTNESYSGRWICSKVVRSIQEYKFTTTIIGCRESMNSVQSS